MNKRTGDEYILQAHGLCKTIGAEQVLEDIALQVHYGECFGIIGPNGSGKSTLVKLLSGVDEASAGQIAFAGRPLAAYPKKQLARRIAVLQQEALPPIGFTVREVVEMGRYPYQNWLGEEAGDPHTKIEEIMRELDLLDMADRPIEALSGGERQRVALAKVVAQQPELLMLDEPTTYLDIGYQQQMMQYIKKWQQDHGLTVLAVLHDLNLAALYCDRLMIIHDGRLVHTGKVEEILSEQIIKQVYGVSPTIVRHPVSGVPQVLLSSFSDGHSQRLANNRTIG